MYLHRLIVAFFANLLPAPVMSATELQCDVKNGWQPFCNYCYLIPRYQLTWREAEKYCVSQKAHLSSLRSEDEMNFLTRLVTNAEVWSAFLGVRIEWRPKFLFRFTPLFSNADGTTADYFRWNEGEPNYHNEQENCVEVRTDGYLNDCRCDRPQKFICKKAKNVRTPPLTCPICAPPIKCPTPTICAPPTRCPTPVPNTCAPPATCPTPVPTTCAPPVTCPNPVPTTCAPPATCPTPVQTTCAPPLTCPTPVPTTCAPPTTCPTPVPTTCAPPTTCPTPVPPTGATSPTLLPLCPILSPAELPTSKPGNVTIFPVLQTPDDVKGPCMLVALPNPQFYGFVVDLLGRLSAGRSIAIRGRAKPLAERISFNLITANGIPLHLGFRIKDQTIVMSSNLNGTEDIKEITADPFPFGPEHDFEVIIQCNVNLFNLTVNSALQLDFTNRLCNVQNITALKMWRDLSLTDVRLM